MRTLHTIGLVTLAALIALGNATPAAAKIDKCAAAIAGELAKAATKNIKAAIKGQTPGVTLNSAKIDKKCASSSPPGGYAGCPGVAGCPNDQSATIAGYEACLNCVSQEVSKDIGRLPDLGKCGNGTKDAGEECDADADCPSGKCIHSGGPDDCTCTVCGNKSIEPGEECDPGAQPTGCCANTTCSSSGASACTCVASQCPGFSTFDFTIGTGTTSCGGFCTNNPARTCFSDAGCAAETGGSLGTCAAKVCTFSFGACTTDDDCVDKAAGERCLPVSPQPPASGQITYNDSTTGPLGLGCLYFGGGANTAAPPAPIPNGSTVPFATVCGCSGGATLAATGEDPQNCSRGVGSTKHCIDGSTGTDDQGACTADTDCTAVANPAAGRCAPDAKCYFGPPLPIPGGPAPTCLQNVFASDASGTLDPSTGEASINITLFSRIFAQAGTRRCHNGAAGDVSIGSPGACNSDADCGGDAGSCRLALPCPACVNNKCIGGARHGQSCTPVGATGTTLDCPLIYSTASTDPDASYLSTLTVALGPLTTGTSTKQADADGKFCGADQASEGAFGQGATQGSLKVASLTQNGQAPGSLTDLQPHAGSLAYLFCIPLSNSIVDPIASLPGPGAVSLPGTFQLKP